MALLLQIIKNNKPLILIVAIFLLLNNLPYLAGVYKSASDPSLIYSGAPLINSGDYFVYLSYIEQGQSGLFVKNLYDYQAENKTLLSPLWFIVGQVAKLFGNIGAYHIFRIIFTCLFLAALWWWIKKIFTKHNQRILALAMTLFASGLGVVFLTVWPNTGISPVNLWVSESNTFLNLYQGPLFSLSQTLILLVLGLFIKAYKTKNKKLIIVCGLLNLFLIIIHPYELIIINLLLTAWSVIKYCQERDKKIFKYLAFIYLTSLLAGLYYVWLFQDPAMAHYRANNIVMSRNILEYIFGLGAIFILSIIGGWYYFKNKLFQNDYLKMLVIWAVFGWIMIYLPLSFNRRLSNGWHIPLIILSALALFYLYKKLSPSAKIGLAAILFIVFIFDNLYLTTANLDSTLSSPADNDAYLSLARLDAYQTVKDYSTIDSVIMTRLIEGNRLPAFVDTKVYAGHLAQTWKIETKNKEVFDVWTSHKDVSGWLTDKNIDFIFASSEYIPEFEEIKWLASEPYIRPLIDNEDFIFYQVTPK